MSLFERLFGLQRKASAAPASRPHSQLNSVMSQQGPSSATQTRRELLRVVLRDTLNRHGIPTAWIAAEVLTSTSRTGEKGIHWRLVIKHWDPRLMLHGVAIQHALIKRVTTFDPLASSWLTGISWQFQLADESLCPALPPPPVWTAEPHAPPPQHHPLPPQPTGDVIEGPVHIEGHARPANEADHARADLEALMAVRDADFAKHGSEKTQPVWLSTEPARL